jgi:tetratricopeptide (TPR) repeat protein
MHRLIACNIFLAATIIGAAGAAIPTDVSQCSSAKGDARVASCTTLLRQGGLDTVNRAGVFYDRAVGYTQLGATDSAIADYTEALRLKPDLAQALNNRGALFRATGKSREAIADFSAVIRLMPNGPNAFINRGIAFGEAGDYENAIRDFSQVVRLAPEQAEGFAGRCWARALEGREPGAALGDCNYSLQLRDSDPATRGYRALAFLRLGDFDSAIVDYDHCIESQPNNASFFFGRGIAKLRSGNPTGANEDLASARALDPRIAQIFAGYGIAP